jgi:SAM-dependent methyltransferase
MSSFQRFLDRYNSERIPWDDPLPPPELLQLAERLPPGRMLDLGCGYGRAAIYLARLGWTADGVDFIPQAVENARIRAAAAGVADKATFHLAPVSELSFLHPRYDLALDVGCMHSLEDDELRAYHGELCRLLAPGACYLLFAHAYQDTWKDIDPVTGEETERPHGIPEATLLALFSEGFQLERVQRGTTQVEDRPPWPSAWYWFRRL